MKQTRTWLITGCSTGIGRGIAEAVLQKGENAVVTARDKSRVKNFEERYPGKALAVTLDMERPETIAQAVEQAQERFGSVDVLINNAGHGYRAALEEGEPAAVAELFQTNFFGPVELIKLMVAGGGVMNWSFLSEGLLDEISLVVVPVADGSTTAVSIFEQAPFLPGHSPVGLTLKESEVLDGDTLWLRYVPKK